MMVGSIVGVANSDYDDSLIELFGNSLTGGVIGGIAVGIFPITMMVLGAYCIKHRPKSPSQTD